MRFEVLRAALRTTARDARSGFVFAISPICSPFSRKRQKVAGAVLAMASMLEPRRTDESGWRVPPRQGTRLKKCNNSGHKVGLFRPISTCGVGLFLRFSIRLRSFPRSFGPEPQDHCCDARNGFVFAIPHSTPWLSRSFARRSGPPLAMLAVASFMPAQNENPLFSSTWWVRLCKIACIARPPK